MALRDVKTLRKRLNLPPDPSAADAATSFGVFAPLPFISRMRPGDQNDPLLLQLLPNAEETDQSASPSRFQVDPLQESGATLVPGLLKKYHGRALMVITGTCAVHCRYCFRRHFPYSENSTRAQHLQPALDALAADQSIHEVILSGGDPLTVVDCVLQELCDAIESIPHLKRLRIHTRLPIMIPSRVTDALVETLQRLNLEKFVVIHANHANEIDHQVALALQQLKMANVTLLNQTVLLKGVNDDATALIELSKRLLAVGVLPYYLHQLDEVIGTAHFEVPVEIGKALIAEMRAALPGFAVPRYVKEIPGQPNKTVLA